jgi:hypothetical protein
MDKNFIICPSTLFQDFILFFNLSKLQDITMKNHN